MKQEPDTFKSGEWRICAICPGTIKPKDRVALVWDEVACLDCARAAKADPLDAWMDHPADKAAAKEY